MSSFQMIGRQPEQPAPGIARNDDLSNFPIVAMVFIHGFHELQTH